MTIRGLIIKTEIERRGIAFFRVHRNARIEVWLKIEFVFPDKVDLHIASCYRGAVKIVMPCETRWREISVLFQRYRFIFVLPSFLMFNYCFRFLAALALVSCLAVSCKKEKPIDPIVVPTRLIFKFKFDSAQARLNNIGQPTTVPAGHAAQSPNFNFMSAHYIELAPDMYTALGSGAKLYKAPETTAGGSNAIDFNQATKAEEGETFFSIPIDSIQPGTYEWLRVSLAYQNYDIRYKANAIPGDHMGTGTVASFIGFNTYIDNYIIKTQTMSVNGNRAQGYWGFETNVMGFNYTTSGQAPAGATTVPNPLSSTSPIPAGSCVVTGAFDQPLVIHGDETHDIVVTVSLSTNKSFEWIDDGDGIYQPEIGDAVVDMGVRGVIPYVQY